jgi:uncharacterized membrane protein YedE/YeeE
MTSVSPASEPTTSSSAWVGVASGTLFAVGLALSGMTDPGKVLGFLDVAGVWDPTLAFVMGGAVGFHFLWLRFAATRLRAEPKSARSGPRHGIDGRLLGGAAIFGVGWGMAGYCPGPALVAAAYGRSEALWFALALLAGIAMFRAFERRRQAQPLPAS